MSTKNSIRTGTGKATFGSVSVTAKSKKAQQHQSTFSASINDMKSLLPKYDEVSSFANKYGRDIAKTGGSIPKPGRSIKKLNIEDLPRKYSNSNYVVPEKGKLKPKSRGKIPGDYDLISKFDTTVFTPDSKLTQEMASKLKMDFKSKKDSKSSLLRTENPKQDFAKLSSNIITGIESDLGFGFRSKLDTSATIGHRSLRNDKPTNPEVAMQKAARKTETSIQALKKKINSKRDQWNNEKFGWDGYHYKEPEGIVAKQCLASDKLVANSTPPNEKLAEMSRHFRQSLNINTDMRKAIKTPKSSIIKSGARDKHVSGNASPTSESPGSAEEDVLEYENPCKSILLSRSTGFQVPEKKRHAKTEVNSKLPSDAVSVVGPRRRSNKELSGVMKLQTLLDVNSKENSYDICGNKIEAEEADIPYQKFDFGELKQATTSLVNSFPKTRASKTEMTVQTSPILKTSTEEVKIMPEHFYVHSPKPRGAKDKIEAQDLIKQRLGESVKNVDDAATIASRLGSLMTRVAMSKKTEGASKVSVDTVSLARELRELASSMEKDYGMDGVASQTSGTVETQTDHQNKNLPQPKFTKQMSYTDQLVLRKLREVRQLWTKGADESQSTEDI
ncbi:unnamed protein product [Allacma fusca]|uniref:Uncharacterized protein n=1 Tax=Allacma fusca TaxID=39272 RepID=A0A8J2LT73_9HEXA|nr:unnamed protein product [Allacma fusca]